MDKKQLIQQIEGLRKSRVIEKNMIRTMAPRGLAAAVLAQLAVAYGIPNASVFSDIIFIVILATVIYTTVASRIFYK